MTGVSARPRRAEPARRVERVDRLPPRRVGGAPLELREDRGHRVLVELHPVGRGVARPGPVEVPLADLERVLAERAGHLVHHPLDGHRPLRAPEAPEGGVRDGVGPAAVRGDRDVGQPVAVVGAEHGAVVHRAGEVGRDPAARGEHQVEAEDAPGVVEAHVVVDQEVVPLPGEEHVVVAVEPQLHRASAAGGELGGDDGDEGGLGLLPAEGAAQAADLHGDGAVRPSQRPRDQVLDLARVLRRAEDEQAAALARDRHGDLPLQVEVVLAAHVQPSRDPARGPGQRRLRLPAAHDLGGQDERALGQRLLDGEDGREVLVLHHGALGGPARVLRGVGGHGEERLAEVLHHPVREDGIPGEDRADVVSVGEVPGGHHRRHAGRSVHRSAVEPPDARVGPLAQPDVRVQQISRLGDVVDVEGVAPHVELGAVVGQGGVHRRAGLAGALHGASAWNLRSRLRATSVR